jgi:hypothetical protein
MKWRCQKKDSDATEVEIHETIDLSAEAGGCILADPAGKCCLAARRPLIRCGRPKRSEAIGHVWPRIPIMDFPLAWFITSTTYGTGGKQRCQERHRFFASEKLGPSEHLQSLAQRLLELNVKL